MDAGTKTPTLDLMVCGNPIIIDTNYESLDKAQKALQNALERVHAELDYLENQPLADDVVEHEYREVWE